jgi:uncharacterized damage-inducible protein DinB
MVTPELLKSLYEYNAWANKRLLDACAALDNEQFTRNMNSSFNSVRDTVVHLYGAEWAWNERFHGRSPSALLSGAGFPDLASIGPKLLEMDQYYIDFVSKQTQQDLDRVFHYKSFSGEEFSNPLWQSLHQVSNHATYHRGQVVTMLRQLGVKPVSTDLIMYYRQLAAAARA